MIAWAGVERKNPIIEQFENNLIENMSNADFNIKSILKSIPLSNDYLCKLFKNDTGKTPLQYLTEMRISYASNLIRNNKDNMKMFEIAKMSGFNDPYYFSRVFKKITGRCPSDWE